MAWIAALNQMVIGNWPTLAVALAAGLLAGWFSLGHAAE